MIRSNIESVLFTSITKQFSVNSAAFQIYPSFIKSLVRKQVSNVFFHTRLRTQDNTLRNNMKEIPRVTQTFIGKNN